ncbi:MAG: ArsR/SmtB family transcription factor [Burkholderiaceae bacterium]
MSKQLSTNLMGDQMSEPDCRASSATSAAYQPWVSQDQADIEFILERASRYFSLLAEPARLRILQAVCDKECSVQEIVGQTSLPQPNVSRHLSLLFNAGVLSRRREGTFVFYKVSDPLVIQLCRTVCVHLATSEPAKPMVV